MESWNPVLASYLRMRFISRSEKNSITTGSCRSGHSICRFCGTDFSHDVSTARTRTLSTKRMRKIYVRRKQLSTLCKQNHQQIHIGPSPLSQKQLRTILMKKCLTCNKSAFLPVTGTDRLNPARKTTETSELDIIHASSSDQDQAAVESKRATRKKRRSSICESTVNLKRTSAVGSSPLLKDFLSSL